MSPPVGYYCRWCFFYYFFLFSTTGEMLKFEKRIFQIWVGWWTNHQTRLPSEVLCLATFLHMAASFSTLRGPCIHPSQEKQSWWARVQGLWMAVGLVFLQFYTNATIKIFSCSKMQKANFGLNSMLVFGANAFFLTSNISKCLTFHLKWYLALTTKNHDNFQMLLLDICKTSTGDLSHWVGSCLYAGLQGTIC